MSESGEAPDEVQANGAAKGAAEEKIDISIVRKKVSDSLVPALAARDTAKLAGSIGLDNAAGAALCSS